MTISSTNQPDSITIAVLGSGRVGSALASALAAAGHPVVVGTRDVETAQQRWVGTAVTVADVRGAIAAADLVVNATPGASALERLAGERDALAGKVLLDVSNATTRTADGMPGGLLYAETSLAEELQLALPGTRIVKGLNTMLFSAMADPGALAVPPTAFLSGDDASAKRLVRAVLGRLGWREDWVIDLGGVATARGPEAMALIVPSLIGAIGFAPFALSVSR